MRPGFADEWADLRILAVASIAIPLTWWLALGWSWPMTLAGHDELALAQNLLTIREVASSGRGWASVVYRPDLLGGLKVRDATGPFPLFPLLARLGLSPTGISAVSALAVQSLIGFLGCRTAWNIAVIWGASRRLTVPEAVGAIWLSAFAPALGWRFGYGHLNVAVGLLAFAAGFALITAVGARRLSATFVALVSVAWVLALLDSGQQIVAYGLVFGGPILIGAWLSFGGGMRFRVPLLIVVGAVLVALPALWPMVAYARSTDAPRDLAKAVVVWDFVTSTASDWITSIPWSVAFLPAGRDVSLHHEVNYPIGPLLVLLALVPWRRTRALAIGLGLSLGATLAFSADLEPASRGILAVVPLLKSFRVPARAILPLLCAVPAIATAALLCAEDEPEAPEPAPRTRSKRKTKPADAPSRSSRSLVLGLACGLILFIAPSLVREAGAWLVGIAAVALATRPTRRAPAVAVLLALGACSVGAFRERLLPFENGGARLAEASEMGNALRRARPELEASLARVHLDFEIPVFTVNTAFAAGLSSVDGYAIPTRRFGQLLFALRKAPYQPTAIFFKLSPDEPAFTAIRQLYNIRWRVALPAPGSLAVNDAGPTAGAAWFSTSVSRVAHMESLARELGASGDALAARLGKDLLVVETDPLLPASLPSDFDTRCGNARVVGVAASARSGEIVAEVESPASCPLTFATNFTEDLRATATLKDGRQLPAPDFPAYGALTGVLVPEGAHQVRLRAVPPSLPWPLMWTAIGTGCCLVAAWLAWAGGAAARPPAADGLSRPFLGGPGE